MEQIGERTRDYIQANAGVELTRKLGTDAKMTPQELALIVKQLPVRLPTVLWDWFWASGVGGSSLHFETNRSTAR